MPSYLCSLSSNNLVGIYIDGRLVLEGYAISDDDVTAIGEMVKLANECQTLKSLLRNFRRKDRDDLARAIFQWTLIQDVNDAAEYSINAANAMIQHLEKAAYPPEDKA